MNRTITYRLNEACRDLNPDLALKKLCENLVAEYNRTSRRNHNTPVLDYLDSDYDDDTVTLSLAPHSGMVRISDLQKIEYAFLADDTEVHAHPQFAICLTYKRR